MTQERTNNLDSLFSDYVDSITHLGAVYKTLIDSSVHISGIISDVMSGAVVNVFNGKKQHEVRSAKIVSGEVMMNGTILYQVQSVLKDGSLSAHIVSKESTYIIDHAKIFKKRFYETAARNVGNEASYETSQES